MPLLADYAITPDVFDVTSYSNDDACAARLETIREAMLTEGLVRDLRDGQWRKLFESGDRAWHRRGTELVKKLATQGRLIQHKPVLPNSPHNDQSWGAEALATHTARPFSGGVIVTETVKAGYANDPLVSRIDRLSSAQWWAARSSSVQLARTLADYQKHLDPVLRCSNSIMFIDPHLDPMRKGYGQFGALLELSGGREPAPTIEIHRVCYESSGDKRWFPMEEDESYFECRFRDELASPLCTAGLRAEVFIWDDFHDRYLISNLIGILLPNGFDTGGRYPSTHWTRLGRPDRDNIQREFDPSSNRHKLHRRFSIP